jgi:hypothetical protein
MTTKHKSSLSAALATASGKVQPTATTRAEPPPTKAKAAAATVLVGGHFPPTVRRTLKLLEADTGKRLNELLGEAINDLAAKYGKPQPYAVEE